MRFYFLILILLSYRNFTFCQPGTVDMSFDIGKGFNAPVKDIQIWKENKILIGGGFDSLDNKEFHKICNLSIDGSIRSDFLSGLEKYDYVSSILYLNQKILIGGNFNNNNKKKRNGLLRFFEDGSIDSTFKTDTTFNSFNIIKLLERTDSKILACGYLKTKNNVLLRGPILFNNNGSIDSTYKLSGSFDSTIRNMVIQKDGKVLCVGDFRKYGNYATNFTARLNQDGTLDTTFKAGKYLKGKFCSDIKVDANNKILVVGNFDSVGTRRQSGIVRFTQNGHPDTSFQVSSGFKGVSTFNDVYTLALQPNGKILVGGIFYTYNGKPANRICRLLSNGELDYSFVNNPDFKGPVYKITIQNDGNILVGGSFYNFNPSNHITRLIGGEIIGIKNQSTEQKISIYPNPVSEKLYLNLTETGKIFVEDFCGRIVLEKEVSYPLDYLNVQSLERGVYYIRFESKKSSIGLKFIKY